MPVANDILVIGDSWNTSVITRAFNQRNKKTSLLQLEPALTPHPETIAVHIGTGEPKERVKLSMGPELTNKLWSLSERNYEKAKSQVKPKEGQLLWYKDGKVASSEPAFTFNPIVPKVTATKILKIEKTDNMSYSVEYELDGKLNKTQSSLIIFSSKAQAVNLFPFLRDKIVLVTLSSFTFKKMDKCPAFSVALFNGGADFAIQDENLRLGSYRNLFEDKAAGIHKTADPKTLEGVTKFFGGMGWIDPKEKPKTELSVEAITCDGLALTGTIPDLPGVYFVGGFAARTANFIFEVADQLAESVLGNGSIDGLGPFSMKRFV
jgi:hypothetical protein